MAKGFVWEGKGLINGLDFKGKRVAMIQWVRKVSRQLRVSFGGSLTNVGITPLLER
jgi:hypothetical protein